MSPDFLGGGHLFVRRAPAFAQAYQGAKKTKTTKNDYPDIAGPRKAVAG